MPPVPVDPTLGLSVNPAKLDPTNDEVRIAGDDEGTPSTNRTVIVDSDGRQIVRPWGANTWAQGVAPAANTQATTTKAAGGAGTRHICTGIQVSFVAGASAPTAIAVSVLLRDGASGAGTVVWAASLGLAAVAGDNAPAINLTGLHIRGSVDTAMTLEFAAAGGANTFEVVSFQGVTVTEA